MSKVTAIAWIQVQAERYENGQVTGAKAVKLTQSRPHAPAPDTRLVKVRLVIPVEAFEELRASIDVPIEAVESPEIIGDLEVPPESEA